MKSILGHWRDYRDRVYPDGMTADQSRQLQQAFFAGAWVCFEETKAISCLPEEAAVLSLEAIQAECEEFCKAAATYSGVRGC